MARNENHNAFEEKNMIKRLLRHLEEGNVAAAGILLGHKLPESDKDVLGTLRAELARWVSLHATHIATHNPDVFTEGYVNALLDVIAAYQHSSRKSS